MTEVLLTAGLAVLLMALAFLALGVRVIFVRGGRFPSLHAHSSPELRRRGIGCAHADCD